MNNTRIFFDSLIIALPDARHFDGDTQPRWEIRLKIGDRHLMFNLFQHAVTIAFYLFFCSARLASFCLYFYQFCHNINTNMIPLAPPSQEGIGEACLAPQGAAPAPPLQGGGDEGLPGAPGRSAFSCSGGPRRSNAAAAVATQSTNDAKWRGGEQHGDDTTRDELCTHKSNRSCRGRGSRRR